MRRIILISALSILILTTIFFGFKIFYVKNTLVNTKIYKDAKYGFMLNHPEDWTFNADYGNIFLKEQTKIEVVTSEKFTEKDCFFAYVVLNLPNGTSFEDFFNKFYKNATDKKNVNLGDNNFVSFTSVDVSNKVSLIYNILIKPNHIISFSVPQSLSCQEEVKEIVSSFRIL